MNRRRANALIDRELAVYRSAKAASEIATAWVALERAHIVSQPYLAPRLAIHWTMLDFAIEQREMREVAGQIARLALAPFGAVNGAHPCRQYGKGQCKRISANAGPRRSSFKD